MLQKYTKTSHIDSQVNALAAAALGIEQALAIARAKFNIRTRGVLVMKFVNLFSIAVAATLLLPVAATAQSLSDLENLSSEDRRAYFEAMSPEEREAKRADLKAERDALTPEQRDAKRAERRSKWDALSDEEREARREQMRGRRAEMKERYDSMSPEQREAARQARGDRGERKPRHEKDANRANGEKSQ